MVKAKLRAELRLPEAATVDARRRVRQTFGTQERQGLFVAAAVRTCLSVAVFVWQALEFPFEGVAYVYGLAIPFVFFVLGLVHMAAARYSPRPLLMAGGLFALDVLAMGYFFTTSNPYVGLDIPLHMTFRWDNLHWFFVVLAQSAMALNWRLVAWCGGLIAVVRLTQLGVVMAFGESFTEADIDIGDPAQVFAAYRNVVFVSVGQRWGELFAIAGVTAGLIAVVDRSNRLVLKHALAERARASLARYFSPNVVDALGVQDDSWRRPKRQRIVVMFLDIVGFTRLCADQPPEFPVEILRGYHSRVAEQVFAHNGTLDKYIGDGVMITFGTPYALQNPASDAVACAVAILGSIDSWNDKRRQQGLADLQVGVGIHVGDAIVGDIGDQRRLEFAVIGDVVNRAARLEKLTRQVQQDLVFSDELREALINEGMDANRMSFVGNRQVQGIDQPLSVWSLAQLSKAQS